jgi:hypothetical protein
MTWLLFGASQAFAGSCAAPLAALEKAKGADVAPAFKTAAACDPAAANEAFGRAVPRTDTYESLTALAIAAVDANLGPTVSTMMDLVPDYAARNAVARAIGEACGTDPAVQKFVVGMPDTLKGRAFGGWTPAMEACGAPELTAALEKEVAAPPAVSFDEKYAAVADLYAGKAKSQGLPVLEKAAGAAMASGPFPVVIDAMVKAVTPEGIGAEPTAADRDALVESLKRVGANASPEAAQKLADAMVKVGSPDAAAALLPKLYPKAVQSDGTFLYGVTAVEACGEDKVVHWAVVQEGGKRWSILDDVQAQAKAFKARLKCKDPQPYTVQLTPEPVAAKGDVETWASKVASESPGAKLRAEKHLVVE